MREVLDIKSIIVDGDIDQRLGKYAYGAFMALLPKSSFLEVTFENSPQEVELKLVE